MHPGIDDVPEDKIDNIPLSINHDYWLSSNKMTICVTTDNDGIIISGAPIIKVFIGQSLDNLRGWMQKQGDYREEELFL